LLFKKERFFTSAHYPEKIMPNHVHARVKFGVASGPGFRYSLRRKKIDWSAYAVSGWVCGGSSNRPLNP